MKAQKKQPKTRPLTQKEQKDLKLIFDEIRELSKIAPLYEGTAKFLASLELQAKRLKRLSDKQIGIIKTRHEEMQQSVAIVEGYATM